MPEDEVEITAPAINHAISNIDILTGPSISPIKRMEAMDANTFEEVIQVWCTACLKSNYSIVRRYGGAGDKGRDVIAYINSLLSKTIFAAY